MIANKQPYKIPAYLWDGLKESVDKHGIGCYTFQRYDIAGNATPNCVLGHIDHAFAGSFNGTSEAYRIYDPLLAQGYVDDKYRLSWLSDRAVSRIISKHHSTPNYKILWDEYAVEMNWIRGD